MTSLKKFVISLYSITGVQVQYMIAHVYELESTKTKLYNRHETTKPGNFLPCKAKQNLSGFKQSLPETALTALKTESKKNQRRPSNVFFIRADTDRSSDKRPFPADLLICCLLSPPPPAGRCTLWLQSSGYVNCYL